jgi:hypothetical protein
MRIAMPGTPFTTRSTHAAKNAITAYLDCPDMTERTPIEDMFAESTNMLRAENIVVDALREMVKDEVKKYIRKRIDDNPELKNEMKVAVEELMEAKIKEGYAFVKLAKAGVKLGLELVPPKMREEFSKDLVSVIQKEIGGFMERTL